MSTGDAVTARAANQSGRVRPNRGSVSDHDVVISCASAGETLITMRGELGETAGATVARSIESALMAGVAEVIVELVDVKAFSESGIQELAQGVAAGCRLERGVTLVARDGSSRAAVLAVCRDRIRRRTRRGAVASVGPP